MEATFVKYNTIENTYQTALVNSITEYGYDSGEWVVLEKIHGANACFVVSQDQVHYGKRTSLLPTPNDVKAFYNSHDVFKRYRNAALQVWKQVYEASGFNGEIIIYGEFFGGKYPGVESPAGATTVQKGVHYCPHNDFIAFDIRILDENGSFLNYDRCIKLFERAGFLHVRPQFRGSFQQALEWSQQHNSDPTDIPFHFGLPQTRDNIREGNVIKPVECKFFNNGNRVILKDKNERFAEKAKAPRMRKTQGVPDHLLSVIEEAAAYITDTRLDNVLSKDGEQITRKNIANYIGLLTQDALEDWKKAPNNSSDTLINKDHVKIVNKQLMQVARKIVIARLKPECY